MANAGDILFSIKDNPGLNKSYNILFNTNTDWDTNSVSLEVSYFCLKEEKKFNDGNVIDAKELLVGVGYCEKTNMINVCSIDESVKRYFWVNLDEVDTRGTFKEDWSLEDVKLHHKIINEKWTTENNIKKESKKKKEIAKLEKLKGKNQKR